MKDTVLKVENVSKQYRLGLVGTGTLTHDLNRWWHKIRGKEDPYLMIGEANDRSTKGTSDYVWALNDIDFEVERGEVLGIIGKNGAGKSTLLKLLSKVTTPTTGSIKYKGRIASLLEVGTGFHPELTGRENIYLNGAILGMTKKEITSKINEIIDFSGVERYIDTPVKRYSSGMYVRLAFAVAAHLDSDILIVDEVLAVGDAEFQKKCMGKMKDISGGQGRTVIFVSHNMAAVKNLCSRGIVLEHGKISFAGNIQSCINSYNTTAINNIEKQTIFNRTDRTGKNNVKIKSFKIVGHETNQLISILSSQTLEFELAFQNKLNTSLSGKLLIGIYNFMSDRILFFDSTVEGIKIETQNDFTIKIQIQNGLSLGLEKYSVNVAFFNNDIMEDYIQEAAVFEIMEDDFYETGRVLPDDTKFYTKNKWTIYE